MLKHLRTFTIVVGILASLAPHISAQKTSTSSDEKEIQAYRLTMPAVKKWEATIRHVAAWAKSDPETQAHIKLQGTIDSLRNKDELTEAEQARLEKLEQQLEAMEKSSDSDTEDDLNIAQMAAQITAFKPMAEALRRAGMTPREYAVFSLAMFQAHGFASLKKSGMVKEIPKDVNVENIKFVEEHFAEINALMEEMQKISKGLSTARKGS
jgi:hypothetical protein